MPHIVWDWNGTLLDDLPLILDAANAALGRFGAGPITVTEYRDRFTRPIVGFYAWALDRDVTDDEVEVIDQAFFDHYHAGLDSVGLNEEALDAVARTAEQGATQSILSMWWHDRLVPAVERLGLADPMVLVDGLRGTAGESKTAHLADHLDELARLVPGIGAADITVIGDVADDAAAASASGAACVLVDTGSQSRSALEATGSPVMSSLCEAVRLALANC